MVDSNIKSTSEKETLYIIPFVKDTFWSKDYKEVLQMFNDLQIPLRNIICIESTDIVTESNFDRSFYKKLYELSGLTFIKTNLVEGNSVSLKGFNTVKIVIKNRLQEKDYNVKIIINPPYKRDLHLKILSLLTKLFPSTEIVNLSPVVWLQDILAEKKKGSDLSKYRELVSHFSSIDVIPVLEANRIFGLNFRGDLGLYHLTKNGGFDLTNFRLCTPEKKLAYDLMVNTHRKKCFLNCDRFTYGMDFSKKFKFTFPEINGHPSKKDWGRLCAGNRSIAYSFEKSNKLSNCFALSFDTEVERDNFYDFIHSKFIQFFVWNARRGINIPSIITFIPHFLNVKWEGESGTIDGYKNPITEEMLFEYFNLTNDEIKIIENFTLQNII